MNRQLLATALLAAAIAAPSAFAQPPVKTEDSPFSEFVYERLGATPSIRLFARTSDNDRTPQQAKRDAPAAADEPARSETTRVATGRPAR